MNKAELKNICSKWLWKAFETGTKQDPSSANNSEYWHPSIDLKWSKEMAEEINEYVQQVSRERAIEFEKFLMKTILDITPNNQSVEYAYDTWTNPKAMNFKKEESAMIDRIGEVVEMRIKYEELKAENKMLREQIERIKNQQ